MLPVVLTMISNWFPDAERGRANAIVIMFVPIAGIIYRPALRLDNHRSRLALAVHY